MASLPPFQQLLDQQSRRLLGYLIGMVGVQEAEDCFQETMLAALRAYPELHDDSNLRGWLFTIAHNKAQDSRRRQAVAPVPAGPPEELAELSGALVRAVDGSAVAQTGKGRGGAGADPTAEAVVGAEANEIWTAVAELPPKQRSAVTLRFAADLSHREIGIALDCSESAARRNLHEALNKLREVWK